MDICNKLPLVCISVSCVLVRGEKGATLENYSVTVTEEGKINGERKKKQGAEEGKAELKPVSRPVGRGGVRGAHAPPIPPRTKKVRLMGS